MTQIRNDDMVNILDPDFIKRTEPSQSWKSACSAILALPGLRAFWPMSVVDYQNPFCTDATTHGNDLTANATIGNVQFGYPDSNVPLVPASTFVLTSSQYLSKADGGAANWADITGLEAQISEKGLSVGCWFNIQNSGGALNMSLISKRIAATNNNSYWLLLQNVAGGPPYQGVFVVSQNGAAINGPVGTINIPASTWTYAAGSFDPSSGIAYLQINATTYTQATGYASIFDSNAPLEIASSENGTLSFFDGYISLAYLAASYHTPTQMINIYNQTRSMFGV